MSEPITIISQTGPWWWWSVDVHPLVALIIAVCLIYLVVSFIRELGE